MAPRVARQPGGVGILPGLPGVRGAPSAIEVAAFAWLIAPILLSWFLSRTGRYEGAHVLSSLALAGLVMMIGNHRRHHVVRRGLARREFRSRRRCLRRGAWSPSRSALAMTCAAVLSVLGHYHVLPLVDPAVASNATLVGFGLVSAVFYAAGLAFGAESLARTSVALLYVEEERYRLLAHLT